MMRRNLLCSASLVVFGLCVGPAHAALVSVLTNADLETPDLGFDTFVSVPASGWSSGGDNFNPGDPTADDLVQHWDDTACCGGTAPSPTQFHNHRYRGSTPGSPGGTSAEDAGLWSYQSLGVVEAGDVGLRLSLSAEVGVRSQSAHLAGGYTGTFTAAFRENTAAAALGSALGATASQAVANALGSGGSTTFANTGDATHTVASGDIGKEIFAVISSVSDQDDPGNQDFGFFWDDASFTSIPEPATATLLGLGGLVLLGLTRRRRA